VKLLSKNCGGTGQAAAPALERVKAGTQPYKYYRIETQRGKN
jgi:hypothetical protein